MTVDLTPYFPRLNEAMARINQYSTNPRLDFAAALEAEGFLLDGQIELERIIRCADPLDRGRKRTGWYYYQELPDARDPGKCIGVGVYGSWRGTPERATWYSRPNDSFTIQEHHELRIALEAISAQRDAELKVQQAQAAEYAAEIWAKTQVAKSHPYANKKGIKLYGEPHVGHDGRLLIPVLADDDTIASLQKIDGEGEKRFLTGGRKKGCYGLIRGSQNLILITEGYATACTLHEASGATVYISFDCGNLYEVAGLVKAKHSGAKIIICGDNDHATSGNPGKTKAMQAAETFGLECILPEGISGTDFNDMAAERGISAVMVYFNTKPAAYQKVVEDKSGVDGIPPPAGFLRDVYDYYNATSGIEQKGFAVQTALAIASVVLGRHYKTVNENYTSLYLLNVGKSATGKEHARKIVREVLGNSVAKDLMSGQGYSSAGAVISALLLKPRHISIMDEFGMHLEAMRQSKNSNYAEANSKLMEAIGTCDSALMPQNYSTMTLKKDAASELQNRVVMRPAITLLCMTTPVTFFEALDHKAISNGFIGRFIISISDVERQQRQRREFFSPPETVLDWIERAYIRCDAIKQAVNASEKPQQVTLQITDDAWEEYSKFDIHCIKKQDELERYNMSALCGRSAEMALRIALIAQLASDINSEAVELPAMQWAITYVNACLEKTIKRMKHTISATPFEAAKKEALAAIRENGENGISRTDMNKAQPWAKWKLRERQEIIDALIEADLVYSESVSSNGGRPSLKYFARG